MKKPTSITGSETDWSEPKFLKAAAVCKLLSISPRSLARLEKDRKLIRSVKLLRHRLYPMDEVNKLVVTLKSYSL